MGDIQIFKKKDFSKLPASVGLHKGVVYALLNNEGVVKIGSTSNPRRRTYTLKHSLEDYGKLDVCKIAITEGHTNFRENEREMHERFRAQRINGTELFHASFNEVVEAMKTLVLNDESEIIEKKSEAFSQGMRNFTLGNNDSPTVGKSITEQAVEVLRRYHKDATAETLKDKVVMYDVLGRLMFELRDTEIKTRQLQSKIHRTI